MTEKRIKMLPELVSKVSLQEIDKAITNYPENQRQSAVMRTLAIVQDEHRYLTEELMNAVADYLNMAPIAVYEVATFYSMYEHEPVGENIISVCRSISCYLKGADKVLNSLEGHLGVKCGRTTADGKFTLKHAECLGACVHAPVVQVNKDYHENVSEDSFEQILDKY